ncbi:hypothetical protein [Candidatus Nitrospira bockiana]
MVPIFQFVDDRLVFHGRWTGTIEDHFYPELCRRLSNWRSAAGFHPTLIKRDMPFLPAQSPDRGALFFAKACVN